MRPCRPRALARSAPPSRRGLQPRGGLKGLRLGPLRLSRIHAGSGRGEQGDEPGAGQLPPKGIKPLGLRYFCFLNKRQSPSFEQCSHFPLMSGVMGGPGIPAPARGKAGLISRLQPENNDCYQG